MSKKQLVIVESPAKAKTIEKYLGTDYVVRSSFGHVRDLPKKSLAIDKDHNFEPTYEISPDKKKVIAELKKLAKTAEHVWLASDEDREGEAIAWHLCHALNLSPETTKRIVFHEITKTAIDHAVKHPRVVDLNLVDAQQARRVLDRLVGYELSPILWKKIQTGLSAGRVQSVAVRLIVEREREITSFEPKSQFKVTAVFPVENQELKAELTKPLTDEATVKKFLQDVAQATFLVTDLAQKPAGRNPSPPFTTSSLQQEASTKLGYSVRQTMTLAQRLYENGHITYMRTDSTNLSSLALADMATYIKKQHGDKYYHHRQYKTKSASAQEAHEAIRPTVATTLEAGSDDQQRKLYGLIWRRAIASQMAAANIEKSEITIAPSTRAEKFVAKGEVLLFDGYLKVYGGSKDDIILPRVAVGDNLALDHMRALESFDRPPARYSEAALVRKLEELGIGRPSTYAPTISTIQTRGYIEKRDAEGVKRNLRCLVLKNGQINAETASEVTGVERSKLTPTHLAEVTTDFLVRHFEPIVDYDFTKRAEDDFDLVAAGKAKWQEKIKYFYSNFYPLIAKAETVSREESSQSRLLGHDSKTKQPIVARYGRYGPMLQRGETESDDKPDFAPLPADTTIKTVTLQQALEMFKLPRTVGKTEDGKIIKANIGRFGPYIQIDKLYVSIKPLDPMKITEEEARELYKQKLEKEANKYIKQFASGISIVNGPYGAYITDGQKNARLPKEVKPETVDETTAKNLLAKAPVRKKRTFSRRTKK